MLRRAVVPGLMGGLVLVVWAITVNGILGFKASIDMNRIPDERVVYEVLREHVTEPGRYVVNPPLNESGMFPAGEPVFGLTYGGVGHEAAGRHNLIQLAFFFVVPLMVAWVLLHADDSILKQYSRKLALFIVAGFIVGILNHLLDFGIGGYPLSDALVLVMHDVGMWTVLGFVMAWRIQPAAA